MSDKPSEERTEEPSFHKLKKARERADIPRSQAFLQVIGTTGGFMTLWFFKDSIGSRLVAFNEDLIQLDAVPMIIIGYLARDMLVMVSLPVITGAVAATLLGSILVNRGFVFSMSKIKPSLKHMSFSSYRERTFSQNGIAILTEISIIAVSLFTLLYFVVLYFASDYFRLFACGLSCGLSFSALVGGIYVVSSLFIVTRRRPCRSPNSATVVSKTAKINQNGSKAGTEGGDG